MQGTVFQTTGMSIEAHTNHRVQCTHLNHMTGYRLSALPLPLLLLLLMGRRNSMYSALNVAQ